MNAISIPELQFALGRRDAPIVLDVRRQPAYLEAGDTLAGALRRDPDAVEAWAGTLPRAGSVVVYCVHGHEVSQGVAKRLTQRGVSARYLEGGLQAWRAAQGPLDRKAVGSGTRWVTRERPKIDRIACPWLIARFVDRDAAFLYVPAQEVREVAQTRDAVPYDVHDVHFTHEGERCSFDAFVQHYRLGSDPALERLALIVRGADTGELDLAPRRQGLPRCLWGCLASSPTTTRCSRTAWCSMTRSTCGAKKGSTRVTPGIRRPIAEAPAANEHRSSLLISASPATLAFLTMKKSMTASPPGLRVDPIVRTSAKSEEVTQ